MSSIQQPPQLPFKTPHIPSNRDHEALIRGTLGGLGIELLLSLRLRFDMSKALNQRTCYGILDVSYHNRDMYIYVYI